MATSIQARGSRFQLRVTHKLLPTPFFFTFGSEIEARTYSDQLVALLARGIVPVEMLTPKPRGEDPLLTDVIRTYTKEAPMTASDDALLRTLLPQLACVRLSALTYQWVDHFVYGMKTKSNLTPGTIRKRVGVVARVVDWHIRRHTPAGEPPRANPLRLLPSGYSVYSRVEADAVLAAGKEPKRDKKRDMRLPRESEALVLRALNGETRDDRQRALVPDPAFTVLFQLILGTGMRLREAYTLSVEQVDLTKRIIRVAGSKGHRGVIKPRHVPLGRPLVELLSTWCKGRRGLLFPFWDGDPKCLTKVTAKLSARFTTLFAYAGVEGITEHDLRHEATCRLVEMRAPNGTWTFSEIEICRIMGWSDTRMMLLYASLRGEDLADRMG